MNIHAQDDEHSAEYSLCLMWAVYKDDAKKYTLRRAALYGARQFDKSYYKELEFLFHLCDIAAVDANE